MHVVLVAAARHPLREPFAGGLEALTHQLARGLTQRGVRVTTFAGPGSDPALDVQELEVGPLVLSDTARADVSMPPETWLREHHAYLQLMLQLAERHDVDVVHNNSLHHLPLALAGLVQAPVLTTLHTPPTPWLEPVIPLAGPNTSFAAVSEYTARSWSHVTPSVVVPNGVDVGVWTPGDGGPDLAWSGRMVREKAPHLAIEVARRAGRHVRLAGPVSDPRYFAEEVAPRLGTHATYVGHLDRAGLVRLIGSSGATLVTPDWDEPYGLVAAESLACGTPVLAFDRGGLREVLAPDAGALVDVGGSDDDLDRAARLVPNVEGLSRAAVRAHAVHHCSLETMLQRYLDLYDDLCGGSRRDLGGAA